FREQWTLQLQISQLGQPNSLSRGACSCVCSLSSEAWSIDYRVNKVSIESLLIDGESDSVGTHQIAFVICWNDARPRHWVSHFGENDFARVDVATQQLVSLSARGINLIIILEFTVSNILELNDSYSLICVIR